MKEGKNSATVEAVLKRSHTNALGEHPVKIRITFKRQKKFYPIRKKNGKALYMSDDRWTQLKINLTSSDKTLKKDAIASMKPIDQRKSEATVAVATIIGKGQAFTFDRFEALFINRESKGGVLTLYEKYLKGLLEDERIGSYESYKSAYSSFNRFRGGKQKTKHNEFVRGKELMPEDLNVEVLKKYEVWLKKEGCNKTTIGIYMRSLRIIYNLAIDENPSLLESYPFAKRSNQNSRYKIRTGSGKKGEALSPEDLQRFIHTSPIENTPEWIAKQYWLFMFASAGMNMADVAGLTYGDIHTDSITYVRKKTKDTEIAEEKIEVPLNETMRQVIDKMGNGERLSDSYVFPILSKGLSPLKEKATTKQKTKTINKWLKKLCQDNGLPIITTYWSRHSAAQLLKESGVSIDMISELLGHSDVTVTREYLKRFSLTKKKAAIDGVMNIMKVA